MDKAGEADYVAILRDHAHFWNSVDFRVNINRRCYRYNASKRFVWWFVLYHHRRCCRFFAWSRASAATTRSSFIYYRWSLTKSGKQILSIFCVITPKWAPGFSKRGPKRQISRGIRLWKQQMTSNGLQDSPNGVQKYRYLVTSVMEAPNCSKGAVRIHQTGSTMCMWWVENRVKIHNDTSVRLKIQTVVPGSFMCVS